MWDVKYRPKVFSEVLGQGGSVEVLLSRLRKGMALDASYIFAGGHGSGKTTLARILARAAFCRARLKDGNPCNVCDHCVACLEDSMVAFTEMDAASQGTTADMRRLVDNLVYGVPGAAKRIYLLDEAHRMSRDAQDVLLKPIEDKRVVVIFCTTEPGKLRRTIKSRCETYEIRKIRREDILARVCEVLKLEGVEYDEEAVLTVVDHMRGHVRDILNELETIAQLGAVTAEAVRDRLDLSVVSQYYEVLLALGDASRAIELVEAVCDRVGPSQAAVGIAEAAMNAYRHANKIQSDYSSFDRSLAEQVYARYGASTPAMAQYFLRSGATSTIDVVCDVVAYCTAGGVPAGPVMVAAPPVKVVMAARAAPVAVEPAAVPAEVTTTAVNPAPEATQEPVRPPSQPPVFTSKGVHAEAESIAMPRGGGAHNQRVTSKPLELKVSQGNVPALAEAEFTATFNEIVGSLGPSNGVASGG